MAHGRSALDQAVLRSLGTQLRGDLLALRPIAGNHAQIDEEQRAVLDVEPAAQL